MTLKFNIGGRTLTAEEFKAQAKKAAPRTASESLKAVDSRSEAKVSLGFVVLGYSPEHWAERINAHEAARQAYINQDPKAKAPGTLDEFTVRWMAKNKPKRARSKPYEIEQAAVLCADLMRRAGWLHVRVDELLRG